MEAETVAMIVQNPSDINSNTGIYRIRHMIVMDIRITYKIGACFFAGGMMMAMNMAYRAIPIAPFAISGRIPEVQAPRKVPADQPRYGKVINPYI